MDQPNHWSAHRAKALLTVDDVQQHLGIGRTAAYRLCHSGTIQVVRVGRAIRVPHAALENWIATGGSSDLNAASN